MDGRPRAAKKGHDMWFSSTLERLCDKCHYLLESKGILFEDDMCERCRKIVEESGRIVGEK